MARDKYTGCSMQNVECVRRSDSDFCILNSIMEITVFLLLGVIVLVALLNRRAAARTRTTTVKPAESDGTPKPQEPTE